MDDEVLLSAIHKSFISFNRRAERASDDKLVATFVDSAPLMDLLSSSNNQIIYGRRGTGKTHALKYLADQVKKRGDHAIYLDLRSIGSNGSIYSDPNRSLAERASTLILDVLNAVTYELYSIALEKLDGAPSQEAIATRLDDLTSAVTAIKVVGTVDTSVETKQSEGAKAKSSAGATLGKTPGIEAKLEHEAESKSDVSEKTSRSGTEKVHLNFGNITTSISGLVKVLGSPRIWLLIDEWSEVPHVLQPYLADLIRRTVLPVTEITIRIAAIEHRSQFALSEGKGEHIGLELGADIAADLNLDDFLVFDNDQIKSTAFFKTLLFRHYIESEGADKTIKNADDLVRLAFTQITAFDEFVRAVEGVPRDALNLAAKISTKAYGQRITVQHVRKAARDWYSLDKAAGLRNNRSLNELLTKVIDEVIGKRKARAFLLANDVRDPRIEQLFDSRLLHVLKKGVSAQDEPGKRFDVYKIDYGCYVDLINTTRVPESLFDVEVDAGDIEVPRDDYRSIRRAILRLEELSKVEPTAEDEADANPM